MCAFCAMMAGGTHWTEAGTDAGRAAEAESGRTRYLGRLRRVALINRILDHYGCQAADWANNQYVVQSRAGRTAMAAHLPQVWAAAEEIAGRPLDPLDPALLDALRHTATAQRDRHRRPRPD